MKMFIGAILLFIYVVTPQISMFCGKGIRTLNNSETAKLEIFFVNQNSDREKVMANYYLDNNSVLFISNEKWELEVIKPVNYHIKPVDQVTEQD
ncbi:hypothetical protein [Viridibacillus arvi]|uniref:hypothetical protein n=1 Tax=Viridibacillus arvi TaxID=263475 RepID=UPI003D296589